MSNPSSDCSRLADHGPEARHPRTGAIRWQSRSLNAGRTLVAFGGALGSPHFFTFGARSTDIDLGGSTTKFTSHGPSTVMSNSAPLFSGVHASWTMRAGT